MTPDRSESSTLSWEEVQVRLKDCAIPVRPDAFFTTEHAISSRTYDARLDGLALDRDGNIAIVESKGKSLRSQREGIAQLLEYHAHMRARFAFTFMARIDRIDPRKKAPQGSGLMSQWFNDSESRRWFLGRLERTLDQGTIWLCLRAPTIHPAIERTIWSLQQSMRVPIAAFDNRGTVVPSQLKKNVGPLPTVWPTFPGAVDAHHLRPRDEYLPLEAPPAAKRIRPPFVRALLKMEHEGFPVRRTPLGAGIGCPVGLFATSDNTTLQWWGLAGDEAHAMENRAMGDAWAVITELAFDYGMYGIGWPRQNTLGAHLDLMKDYLQHFPPV